MTHRIAATERPRDAAVSVLSRDRIADVRVAAIERALGAGSTPPAAGVETASP